MSKRDFNGCHLPFFRLSLSHEKTNKKRILLLFLFSSDGVGFLSL